jgi:hypothetical protein
MRVPLWTLPLLFSGHTFAEVLTVGPMAAFTTLDAALVASGQNNEDDEIRVGRGIHVTAAATPLNQSGRAITITGGWDTSYQIRDSNPASTILQGDGASRILLIGGHTGFVTIDGLTFRGGVSPAGGAGISIERIGTSNADIVVSIRNSVFSDNRATGFGTGHAIKVRALQNTQVNIENNDFTGHTTDGGVVNFSASFSGTIKIHRNRFYGNSIGVQPLLQAFAGSAFGTSATSTGTAGFVEVIGNRFWNNATLTPSRSGPLVYLSVDGDGQLQFRANRVNGQQPPKLGTGVGFDALVELRMKRYSAAFLSDNLLIRGDNVGLRANAFDQARAYVHNNTMAFNLGKGIEASLEDFTALPPNAFGLANNISFGNATNLDMPSNPRIVSSNNLLGTDPFFAGADMGDFRLTDRSPARNAGTLTPTGGLSTLDLDGNPRVIGVNVDIGAFEFVEEFANGFE